MFGYDSESNENNTTMKTKDEIIGFINARGNKGAQGDEMYVDIATDEIVDDGLELAQLCHFSDTNELLAYLLDESGNGYFVEYDNLSAESRENIENLPMWEQN